MDCVSARGALLAYHLGSCEDDERDRLEAHLCECPGCLRAYLSLRRALEAAAPGPERADDAAPGEAAARPSAAMRIRLRAEVARRFRPTVARRAQRLLGRPVPLYQAAAAALLLLGLGLLPRWLGAPAMAPAEAPQWARPAALRAPRHAPLPGLPEAAEEDPLGAKARDRRELHELREVIDTSRPEAASLSIL